MKPNLFRSTAIGIRHTDFATRSVWKTSRRFGKGKTAGTSQGLSSSTMRFHTFWDRTRRNATRGIDSYINTGSRYGKYGSGSRTKIWQWHSIVVDNVWLLDQTISLVITWRLLAPPKVGSGTGASFRSLGGLLHPNSSTLRQIIVPYWRYFESVYIFVIFIDIVDVYSLWCMSQYIVNI